MMESNQPGKRDDSNGLEAPPKLLAAFAHLGSSKVFVPQTLDGVVLNAARQHLAQPETIRVRPLWRWLMWPALATACILLAMLAHNLVTPPGRQGFAREDLNRDGRVDILDAFQFARDLQSGVKPETTMDLNGDGVVDRRDAEVIATHAVKLEKGGRS